MRKAQQIFVPLACGLNGLLLAFLLASVSDAKAEAAAPDARACMAARAAQTDLLAFPRSPNPLRIWSGGGVQEFAVEVAATKAERQQGLMFRCALAEGTGLLFLFAPPRRIGFYMRNTYLPLDVIYIAPDGRIDRIVTRRDILSEHVEHAHGRVQAVLEIAAGEAAARGIQAGDMVRHPRLR